MEYKAEDFISFIEQGRRDKISPNALDLIAKRYRELERLVLPQADVIGSLPIIYVKQGDSTNGKDSNGKEYFIKHVGNDL